MTLEKQDLFGGSKFPEVYSRLKIRKWHPADWKATDDRVRGGSSQSYLEVGSSNTARFYGNLDTKTLGGAGFASQRTTTDKEGKTYDLSGWDGILLSIVDGDDKKYTLNVKDEILPPDHDTGREQSSVSWEYDFYVSDATVLPTDPETDTRDGKLKGVKTIKVPWAALKPTYRGREKKDAEPLDTKRVKRFSLMMRSFFEEQSGDFELLLRSISVYRDGRQGKRFPHPYTDHESEMQDEDSLVNEKLHGHGAEGGGRRERGGGGFWTGLWNAATRCVRHRL